MSDQHEDDRAEAVLCDFSDSREVNMGDYKLLPDWRAMEAIIARHLAAATKPWRDALRECLEIAEEFDRNLLGEFGVGPPAKTAAALLKFRALLAPGQDQEPG